MLSVCSLSAITSSVAARRARPAAGRGSGQAVSDTGASSTGPKRISVHQMMYALKQSQQRPIGSQRLVTFRQRPQRDSFMAGTYRAGIETSAFVALCRIHPGH